MPACAKAPTCFLRCVIINRTLISTPPMMADAWQEVRLATLSNAADNLVARILHEEPVLRTALATPGECDEVCT